MAGWTAVCLVQSKAETLDNCLAEALAEMLVELKAACLVVARAEM